MVKIICKYCQKLFIAKRKSRIICDNKECQNKYHAEKNREKFNKHPDKYDLHVIEQSCKNIKRDFRKWNEQNIDYKNGSEERKVIRYHICDDCKTEFFVDISDSTPWGAGVCPKCGLVEKSMIDRDIWAYHFKKNPQSATLQDIMDWKSELKRVNIPPILKKYAIYLNEHKDLIDFVEEFKALRILKNRLQSKEKKKEYQILTTAEEEQICWKALNIAVKNKNILNR